MFEIITPEQAGLNSNDIFNFISMLNNKNITMHGILMMKGNQIFTETYYAPFHKDYNHRLYSQTKSFVSIAIGLLIDDHKIKLEDTLYSYFKDDLDFEVDEYLKKQTIQDTLMMATCVRCENWFKANEDDRVKLYFKQKAFRPSGLIFEYDSAGSMVLSALVEKITKMSLFNFLNERIFKKLGTFKTAYMLKTPNNYCWGDSGLMATLRDVASFGRLLMNEGVFNNEHIISKEYVKEATRKHIDNHESGYFTYRSNGYGYQIWRLENNGFAFFGMGNELTFMFPDKDFLFTCFGNDQGNITYREIITNGIYDLLDKMSNQPLKENKKDYNKLFKFLNNQNLRCLTTEANSSLISKINNITYICEENPMKIKEFTLSFDDNKGEFKYENETGKKSIHFGINHNEFAYFEENGYSDLIGKEISLNNHYKYAASLAFTSDFRVFIDCRIIDKYLGSLFILISFKNNNAYLKMVKYAENFLDNYNGEANCIVQ